VHVFVRIKRNEVAESATAHIALVRPLAGVRAHVRVQRARMREGRAAPFAHVGLRLLVNGANVGFQIAQLAEALRAQRARERFLAGVHAHVCLQRDFLREPALAVAALVRLFAAVRAHVTRQVLRLAERLAAEVAHVLFGAVVVVDGPHVLFNVTRLINLVAKLKPRVVWLLRPAARFGH